MEFYLKLIEVVSKLSDFTCMSPFGKKLISFDAPKLASFSLMGSTTPPNFQKFHKINDHCVLWSFLLLILGSKQE